MKIALSFFTVLLFIFSTSAQSRTIGKDEYDKAFQFAVRKTNADYPFIFKITTTFIENGKTIRTISEVRENQSSGYERIKWTMLADGRETNRYQIRAGFGNVFCSDDGATWKASEYECSGPSVIYGRREAESVEYGVTEKTVDGKKVSVYREYKVFAPSEGSRTRSFEEKVATIDARGFFLTVVGTEGTLEPRAVTLTREQTWITQAKIKPIVAPQ